MTHALRTTCLSILYARSLGALSAQSMSAEEILRSLSKKYASMLIVQHQQGSASLIQRKEVLISDTATLSQLLNQL